MKTHLPRLAYLLPPLLLIAACSTGGAADDEGTQANSPSTTDATTDEPTADEVDPLALRFGIASQSPGPGHSPYSALPLYLGYWAEEGLDVEVIGFTGSGEILPALGAGQVDAAISSPGAVFAAASEGLDLITFYDQVTSGYLVPAVLADSDITEVIDMEGATVGVSGLGSSTVQYIQAMVADAGGDPSTLEFLAIGQGAEAAEFIRQGHVDVIGLWDIPQAELTNLGFDLRVVASEKFLNMGYQFPLTALRSTFDAHRNAMVGLARGIAKATLFASTNPEAAVRITWEVYPESKPLGVSEEEALAQGVRIIEARAAFTDPVEGVWGLATDQSIKDHMEAMLSAGVIDATVEVASLWTPDLLEEINDFDASAIINQAENWQP